MATPYILYSGPIVTRAEAKAAGLKRYFTGKPCPWGHVCERWVASYTCDACQRIDCAARYAADTHGRRTKALAWHGANIERSREISRRASRRRYQGRKPYHAAWIEAHRAAWNAYCRARFAQATAEKREAYRVNVRSRRALLRGAVGNHTAAQILAMLRHQRSKCRNCRIDIRSGYHVDHIVPIVAGGSNDIANIQLLCIRCNGSKGAQDFDEWARSRGRILRRAVLNGQNTS